MGHYFRSLHRLRRRQPVPAVDAGPEVEFCVSMLPEPRAHLLAVLEGVVVDSPIPLFHPDSRQWAATCWPDAGAPDGWGRALWWESASHRGWIPVGLHCADVVEFAADIPVRRRWRRTWQPVRWYGIALQEVPAGLVVYGPYADAASAEDVAHRLRLTLGYYFATRPPNRRLR